MARTDAGCSIQSPSLVAQISSSKISKCRCTTTRMLRDCHFHLWGTWCRLQTVPWYTYMNRSQGPDSGMPALCLHKGCLWSWKFHPCGQHHRHEWLPAMTGNHCCCCFCCSSFNQKYATSTNCNTISTFPSNCHCNLSGSVCALVILGDNMCCVNTINNNNNSIYLYSTISPELQFCSEALVTTLAWL